jgi:hypothetical protein
MRVTASFFLEAWTNMQEMSGKMRREKGLLWQFEGKGQRLRYYFHLPVAIKETVNCHVLLVKNKSVQQHA